MKLSKIAFRNIMRNKRRSILSGSAIAVAAASIVFLFALLNGMTIDLSNNIQTFYTGTVRIMHEEFEKNKKLNPMHLTVKNPGELICLIKEIKTDAEISERITFPTRIYRENSYFNAMGIGVRFPDEINTLFLLVCQFFICQQVAEADDSIHWCSYFMAHVCKELTFCLIRSFSLFLGKLQR